MKMLEGNYGVFAIVSALGANRAGQADRAMGECQTL
jgi:hypothetical protein